MAKDFLNIFITLLALGLVFYIESKFLKRITQIG